MPDVEHCETGCHEKRSAQGVAGGQGLMLKIAGNGAAYMLTFLASSAFFLASSSFFLASSSAFWSVRQATCQSDSHNRPCDHASQLQLAYTTGVRICKRCDAADFRQ